MKYYVGIDLGTTNSAISSFDGENVRVWKSKKDQNDVTPSAIYVDKRGKRFYGKEAYLKNSQQPQRCAVLFKRFMGTSTKIKLGDEELTPEECSAEILRELYKNLPEEIRNSDEVATVITVPAAFNQMQNAATLEAAQMAGIGKVALMQEPVAAIMSVMKGNNSNSNFVIYDLGGGTLDIAIAESISGKVNLLAHGGKVMCGGRDFDRIVMNNIVNPWLRKNYNLPDDWRSNDSFKKLERIAAYLSEIAKIELSSDEVAKIEGETGINDRDGEEIYLDIELTRERYNKLIEEMVVESVNATRETIEKSGLTVHDIDRIIFIGGPTNYKPLRDRVVQEIGIEGSIEVNPMTAVSEGASIFAESIDWSSNDHGRKSTKDQVKSASSLGLSFKYISRTTDEQARIAAILEENVEGYTFEISSVDTGWTSGSMTLKNKAGLIVPLSKRGDNTFSVVVYDKSGRNVPLENKNIIITKTMATVGAILASHSIGIEVRENSNSTQSTLDYLVREGDTLPAKGQKRFRAAETIKAGSINSINFKLWEGEIEDSVEDNRFIGHMKITGDDFDYGMIMAGAEIICDYTVNDSGSIDLELSIPSISEVFNSGKNFYSRQEGQVDLDNAIEVLHKNGRDLLDKIKNIGDGVKEGKESLTIISEIASIAINTSDNDREEIQHLTEKLLGAKKLFNKIRRDNIGYIRQKELDGLIEYYEEKMKNLIQPEDREEYKEQFELADKVIDRKDSAFDNVLSEIRYINYKMNMKYDPKFLYQWFLWKADEPEMYKDRNKFNEIVAIGLKGIENDNRSVVEQALEKLYEIKIYRDEKDEAMLANIVKG